MSATTQQTKIFGIRVGVDPKILILGLVATAAVLFWYNSRGEDEGPSAPAGTATRPQQTYMAPSSAAKARAATQRRASNANDRAALKLRAIDATRGDIDPTLRLDLLARLQNVGESANSRNLFEMGPSPEVQALMKQQMHGPTIMPKPIVNPQVAAANAAAAAAFSIPLKYYGFVKPMGKGTENEGLFLDGDDILVGTEGQVLNRQNHQYLVVALTPNSARLEDVQQKKGQTLPVVPEALP